MPDHHNAGQNHNVMAANPYLGLLKMEAAWPSETWYPSISVHGLTTQKTTT